MAAVAISGTSVSALATTPSELEAQLAAMQAEIAQLKSEQSSNEWMTERRAAEVRSLVQSVMADEQALAASSASAAGHNGKNFILSSEDGKFELKVKGQLQFRYIFNDADVSKSYDGFQTRRAKLKFEGKAYGFGYKIALAHSRKDGNVETDYYEISYKFDNGVKVKGGRFKLPFARQELTSSTSQVAVDRSMTTEHFTLNKSEGIQIDWIDDAVAIAVALSDGGNNETADFKSSAEYAVTGRVDGKLAGNWKQAKDAIAWSGEETGAFIGAAGHYEKADNSDDKTFAFTIDGLVEFSNVALTAAYFFVDSDGVSSMNNQQHGYYAQGSYNIDDTWVPFVRYNFIDYDTAGADDTQAVTLGINYLFDKHNAKFTLDCVYIFDGGATGAASGLKSDGEFSSGLGLVDAMGQDEMALRAQMQLLF